MLCQSSFGIGGIRTHPIVEESCMAEFLDEILHVVMHRGFNTAWFAGMRMGERKRQAVESLPIKVRSIGGVA